MTILVLLLALVVSHFARGLRVIRQYGFALAGMRAMDEALGRRFPGQRWLMVPALIVALLVICVLALWLVSSAAGQAGLFLLALAVLLYTLGPRELDADVEAVLAADDEVMDERLAALGHADGGAAAGVMRAALERWFGIIFWFVVLNILGALLYRLCCEYVQNKNTDQDSSVARLLAVLQWPVAQLMTLALAISADFDRVWHAWRHWHAEHGWRPFGCEMLLFATEDVAGAEDQHQAAARSMQLVWRMLIAWLVVLSLLLLAGWII